MAFSQMSAALEEDTGTRRLLAGLAALLKGPQPWACLRVEGHTDDRPSWGVSNQRLSEDRAQSVVEFLVSTHVSFIPLYQHCESG